jgi:dTDP-4-dehydrorhamnose reductase
VNPRLPKEMHGQACTTLAAAGQTSWHGFTNAILCELLQRLKHLKKPVEWRNAALGSLTPIATSAYPVPARRPAYSILSNDKIARIFALRLPDWGDQLRLALEDFRFEP